MNIIYYFWDEYFYSDMKEAFEASGATVFTTDKKLTDYSDASQCNEIFDKFIDSDIDIIFSFDYYPAIAEYAHIHLTKYVSFVYDCPHLTLYSNTILYDEIYLFIFDKIQCDEIRKLGAKHVFHQQMVTNAERMSSTEVQGYNYDISFIGSLYSNTNYDKIAYLPPKIKGFLDGLISAQCLITEGDIINHSLTDSQIEEISKYVQIELDPRYSYNRRIIFEDFIREKVSSLDRINALMGLAKYFNVDVFSNVDESAKKMFHRTLNFNPPVDYYNELPVVYRTSQINLNITIRSIKSTWANRCLDIMASNGFLLSNYKPELAENFVDGEDCAIFFNTDDLIQKADFYLKNETLREQIAANGCGKVKDNFTYNHAIKNILGNL